MARARIRQRARGVTRRWRRAKKAGPSRNLWSQRFLKPSRSSGENLLRLPSREFASNASFGYGQFCARFSATMTATLRTFDEHHPPSQEIIDKCVHCGFCLATCPTYALWHEEMDSPRGRILLMGGLVDGSIELTDQVVTHLDRCLGCMACVTSCPSGVQYDRLIEQARVEVEQHRPVASPARWLRSLLLGVLPHR